MVKNLPIGGLYATYHPLQEPEKSIEFVGEPTQVFDPWIVATVNDADGKSDPKRMEIPHGDVESHGRSIESGPKKNHQRKNKFNLCSY